MGFAMFTRMPKSLGNINMLGTMKLIAWKPHVQMYLCKQCCECKMKVCWAYKLCLQMSTVSQSNFDGLRVGLPLLCLQYRTDSGWMQDFGTHSLHLCPMCMCSIISSTDSTAKCMHTLYLTPC